MVVGGEVKLIAAALDGSVGVDVVNVALALLESSASNSEFTETTGTSGEV